MGQHRATASPPRTRVGLVTGLVAVASCAVVAGSAVGVAQATALPAALPAPVVTAAVAPVAPGASGSVADPERRTGRATRSRAADASDATTRPRAGRRMVIDSYTVAIGSQSQIDECQLVLYWEQPLWFAAHNYCGYQWLATVPTGTTIVVRSGRAAGRYRVTGHARIDRQSGPLPRFDADLVLQTCVGSGTGFSLAERV